MITSCFEPFARQSHHPLQAIFWVLESMIPFGNHPLFLFLLGWMLSPKPAFMKLTTTPAVRAMTFTKQVFQDIVLPINKLEEQIDKVCWSSLGLVWKWPDLFLQSHELFDTYPVLVYPCKIYDHGAHTGQLRFNPFQNLASSFWIGVNMPPFVDSSDWICVKV